MCWKQLTLCLLTASFATGQFAAAQGPTDFQGLTASPMFQTWITRRIGFSLVNGRVVTNANNGPWMFASIPKQISTDGLVREQVEFHGNGATGSVDYSFQRRSPQANSQSESKIEFSLKLDSEGRFTLRYSDKDQPEKCFDFAQVPRKPVSLSLTSAGKPRVLRAPTIWHLLISNEEDCGKQFLPMLDSMHPNWHVARTVRAAEDELVKMASASCKVDRKQWEAWVDELGDPTLWTRRNRADQNLRAAGPAVLGYLNRLDMDRLDAEQKSRIRRIIRDLSAENGEDTPERVASMLLDAPLVWLAMLSQPEESTRVVAVQRLASLVGAPIAVDPKAPPESQVKAREELRTRIEKIVGESSMSDDAPKPTAGSHVTSASMPAVR